MNGKVASLNVGEPRLVTYRGMSFRTGIFKEPLDHPLTLKKLNFAGDGQADLFAHGGIDKAVYCCPFEHYDFWGREIGRADLPMGKFGENVTTAGCSNTSFASATSCAWAPQWCRSPNRASPATSS